MTRPLNIKRILFAGLLAVLVVGGALAGRDLYLRKTGLQRARAHAEAAFQGKQVTLSPSCIGFWRQELPEKQRFELYMETSNGMGMAVDWTFVAVKTSQGRHYERVEPFEYAEARAYGDSNGEFIPARQDVNPPEGKTIAVQERMQAYSDHPRVVKIFQLRLVNSLAELDSILTDLGFTRQ